MVGLGAIGLPMAVNLRRSGFALKVRTRSRTAEQHPDLNGSQACSSAEEVSRDVDVLILCVSDDAAVDSVLFGRQGAATSLPRGRVVLDCSTIAPSTAVASAELRYTAHNHCRRPAPSTGTHASAAGCPATADNTRTSASAAKGMSTARTPTYADSHRASPATTAAAGPPGYA